MMGAASTPVFLVIFNGVLLLLVAIPLALVIQIAWGGTWSNAATVGILGSFLLLSTGGCGLFWLWWRKRRQRPIDLKASWLSSPRGDVNAGEKATGLHHLGILGFTVAEGWVLAPELLSTPALAAHQISVCCRRRGIGRIIVRSSFLQEDADHLYPGVFRSVGDVDASDLRAIREALESVVASGDTDIVDRYRQRIGRGAVAEPRGCVLVQRWVEASTTGVMCSYHPSRQRLDEVTVEAGPPAESSSVDVYSQLQRRWLSNDCALDDEARQDLLDALRVGEVLLKGPVVIEFGLRDGSLVLFQLRRAPRASMVDLWTQSGPVGLNPEPLPQLFSEIIYGSDLELLRRRLASSLLEHVARDAPPPEPRLVLHHARALVEYGSIASSIRFHPRLHGPLALVIRLLARARAETKRARRALSSSGLEEIDGIRHLAEIQSRCQETAENLRALHRTLSSSIRHRPEFAPFIPWHRWLSGLILSEARAQERLRELLHSKLVSSLSSLAPTGSTDDEWHHLALDDWRRARSGEPLESSPSLLNKRRETFEGDAKKTMPTALVSEEGALVKSPHWPPAGREGTDEQLQVGRFELHPLVRGDAAGKVVSADSSEPTDGQLVLVPDTSIQWLDRVVGARGVLLVGGCQLLSHLALAILELEIPALAGLTSEEAAALEGREARIDGDLLIVDSVTS